MADKELRKMNRTELIEIIYALQQNERSLREENEELRRRLDEKLLKINKAGSIAEAALSLNRIFEDAQNAAEQYLFSLSCAEAQKDDILNRAEEEAWRLVQAAREECTAMRKKRIQSLTMDSEDKIYGKKNSEAGEYTE